ncbi:hypothetical protein PoB_002635600 [Plakobranchus ocellatus]|uniref:Uncharacterized protein n=1 Tax=Plakobranchus ocellatus TaxID=259542 RepID=A0AAV3ZZ92_9GAST|nr:hypothetical protein PoB_002635600 [Plakobranchus ocellatus]
MASRSQARASVPEFELKRKDLFVLKVVSLAASSPMPLFEASSGIGWQNIYRRSLYIETVRYGCSLSDSQAVDDDDDGNGSGGGGGDDDDDDLDDDDGGGGNGSVVVVSAGDDDDDDDDDDDSANDDGCE